LDLGDFEMSADRIEAMEADEIVMSAENWNWTCPGCGRENVSMVPAAYVVECDDPGCADSYRATLITGYGR